MDRGVPVRDCVEEIFREINPNQLASSCGKLPGVSLRHTLAVEGRADDVIRWVYSGLIQFLTGTVTMRCL